MIPASRRKLEVYFTAEILFAGLMQETNVWYSIGARFPFILVYFELVI